MRIPYRVYSFLPQIQHTSEWYLLMKSEDQNKIFFSRANSVIKPPSHPLVRAKPSLLISLLNTEPSCVSFSALSPKHLLGRTVPLSLPEVP